MRAARRSAEIVDIGQGQVFSCKRYPSVAEHAIGVGRIQRFSIGPLTTTYEEPPKVSVLYKLCYTSCSELRELSAGALPLLEETLVRVDVLASLPPNDETPALLPTVVDVCEVGLTANTPSSVLIWLTPWDCEGPCLPQMLMFVLREATSSRFR